MVIKGGRQRRQAPAGPVKSEVRKKTENVAEGIKENPTEMMKK